MFSTSSRLPPGSFFWSAAPPVATPPKPAKPVEPMKKIEKYADKKTVVQMFRDIIAEKEEDSDSEEYSE